MFIEIISLKNEVPEWDFTQCKNIRSWCEFLLMPKLCLVLERKGSLIPGLIYQTCFLPWKSGYCWIGPQGIFAHSNVKGIEPPTISISEKTTRGCWLLLCLSKAYKSQSDFSPLILLIKGKRKTGIHIFVRMHVWILS